MSKKYQWLTLGSLLLLTFILYLVYDYRESIAMLNPKGWVALRERDLMITAIILMLLVVIPVFIMTVYIITKFRATNKKAEYSPDWDNNVLLEVIWWGFPTIIVIFLSIIAWQTSHELDPFKQLESDVKPLRIQVVALEWKWLFLYPEQNIATVNFIQIPEKTPINFEITADAPMNSFWVPQLGGQIYAMAGMRTKLHLIADEAGEFKGSSANLSGDGFSGMVFTVKASTESDFNKWVENVKQTDASLGTETYQQLAKQSKYNPTAFYKLQKNDLFDWIVMKPMMKVADSSQSPHKEHKE
jgi:cytochrome o ubiquinol oxidase subunit 2